MGLKSAIDSWYDRQNYFSQTVIQFFTSILVLFFITGLGGLVFCGFENAQARARHAAPQPGTAQQSSLPARRGFAARPAARAPAARSAGRCARGAA